MNARFGPAGRGEAFATLGYKKSEQLVPYLKRFSLDAFEVQFGRGVHVNKESAEYLGQQAAESDIALSVHSPYYISLSSMEEEKRDASIGYILQSARAARLMGARRIIVHSGSCGKLTRLQALELACDTLRKAKAALLEEGFDEIILCPETMGKIGQLGTLSEVMELCKVDESFIPCIDFGHINAREQGSIKSSADFERILAEMENALGYDRIKQFHSHFSKIEYTTGGEKRHLTFEDVVFGPDFPPLAELICKKNLYPTFICESAGTQDTDAAFMKKTYLAIKKENA